MIHLNFSSNILQYAFPREKKEGGRGAGEIFNVKERRETEEGKRKEEGWEYNWSNLVRIWVGVIIRLGRKSD